MQRVTIITDDDLNTTCEAFIGMAMMSAARPDFIRKRQLETQREGGCMTHLTQSGVRHGQLSLLPLTDIYTNEDRHVP